MKAREHKFLCAYYRIYFTDRYKYKESKLNKYYNWQDQNKFWDHKTNEWKDNKFWQDRLREWEEKFGPAPELQKDLMSPDAETRDIAFHKLFRKIFSCGPIEINPPKNHKDDLQ